MMNRPVDKITVLNRAKKSAKQHVQKSTAPGIITSAEFSVKKAAPSASKDNLRIDSPDLYDGNRLETLVGEERLKQPFAGITTPNADFEIMKSASEGIDFGGGNTAEFHNSLPRIVDLCLEDKKRILQLINELANCKEEKEVMTKDLNYLKETIKQLQNENKLASERFASQKEALALEVENLVISRDNLSSDLENLQNCIEIQKNEIEKQASYITTLKMEKRLLQKQLLEYDCRLKAVHPKKCPMNEKPFNNLQLKTRNEYNSPAGRNTDKNISPITISPQQEKSEVAIIKDSKVTEQNCKVNNVVQKIEDRNQLLISELFFRLKDVPETLENIFFKNPFPAQPTQTWDYLL